MTDRQLYMKMDQVSLSKKLSTVDKCREMALLLTEAYFSDAELLCACEEKADGSMKPVGMVFEFREENQGRVTLPLCFSGSRFAKAAPCRSMKMKASRIVEDFLKSDYPGIVFNAYSEDPGTTRIIIPKDIIRKIIEGVKNSVSAEGQ